MFTHTVRMLYTHACACVAWKGRVGVVQATMRPCMCARDKYSQQDRRAPPALFRPRIRTLNYTLVQSNPNQFNSNQAPEADLKP